MTGTVKVYEIAEDLKLDTETVLQKLKDLGIPAKNKMSKVDAAYVDQIRSSLARDRQASYVEVEVAPGVRKLKRVEAPAPAAPKPAPARPAPAHEPVVARAPSPAPERPAPVRAPEPAVERPAPTPAVSRPTPAPASPDAVARAPEAPAAPEPVVEKAPEAPAPKAPEPTAAEKPAKPVAEKAPEPVVEKAPEPVAAKAPEATPAPKAPEATPAVERAPEPVAEKAPAPAAAEPVAPAPPAAVTAPAAPPAPEPAAAPVQAEAPRAPEPQSPPRPPADMPSPAAVAQASKPSQPPPPAPAQKKGVQVWDPTTKQVIWMPSESSQSSGPRTSFTAPSTMGAGAKGAKAPPRLQTVFPAPSNQRGRPGPRVGPNRPGGPRLGPGPRPSTPSATPSTVDPKRRPVIKIEQQISLQELARRMNLKATEVLMKLLQVGGGGKNINSTLDAETATLLASEFGFTVEDVALDTDALIKKALPADDVQDSSPRPPVVTVMGHVDHGKTTLLDAVLGMRVAEGEAGGITQEVRAYRVNTPKGPVVFFDTPGHEAFTALRMRGAQATDVAVLVVAADDGVMPTTVEAINHAKVAKVPIVVALNKMDKPDANPNRVLQQLLEHEVITEQFGGTTLAVQVSAKTRMGIDDLLENLALQTEILDLKANAKKAGVGTVFESKLDKGRGAVARVLVQEGIVRNGDVLLSASGAWGRIRAMFDDRGKPLDKAGPSTPIEILGLSEPPTAGDKIYVCADARKAQEAAEALKLALKKPEAGQRIFNPGDIGKEDKQITINVVIKADAQGAVEGLRKALTELSTDKVKVSVLHAAVGAITETDVQLAVPSRAVIIGFNVRPAGKAGAMAEDQKVTMRFYNVIYEAVDDIKALMVGQLKPTLVQKTLGRAEVRQVFNITKVGLVAGSMVLDGVMRRGALVRVLRNNDLVRETRVGSLRRIKEDVREVTQGFECGIGLENGTDIKAGDVIEAYEVEEVAAVL